MNSQVNNQQLEEYKKILIDAICDEELGEMVISAATYKELHEIAEAMEKDYFDAIKIAYYFANLSSELVYDIVEHNNFVPMKLFKLMHKSSEIIHYHKEHTGVKNETTD